MPVGPFIRFFASPERRRGKRAACEVEALKEQSPKRVDKYTLHRRGVLVARLTPQDSINLTFSALRIRLNKIFNTGNLVA